MLATLVVFLFCLLYTAAIAAQTKGTADANAEANSVTVAANSKTRTAVESLGFGTRVDVKLKSGLTARGRITGLADHYFVVTDATGAATPIAFTEVSRITQQKEKLGIFHRPWVGIMFTAAGVASLIVIALEFFN